MQVSVSYAFASGLATIFGLILALKHKHLAQQHSKLSYNEISYYVYNTIRVWRQTVKEFKLNVLSFATPISANPSFTPSVINGTFDRWKKMGFQNVGHLYTQGKFVSFQQLKEKYNLETQDFFRYLQALCKITYSVL